MIPFKRKIFLCYLFLLIIPLSAGFSGESLNYKTIVLSPASMVINTSNSTSKDYHIDSSIQFQYVGNVTDSGMVVCHGFYCIVRRYLQPFDEIPAAITILIGSQAFLMLYFHRKKEKTKDDFMNTVLLSLFIVSPMAIILYVADKITGTPNQIFLSSYRLLIYSFLIIIVFNLFKGLKLFVKSLNDNKEYVGFKNLV